MLSSRNYILTTPVKNEADNINSLIDSVNAQDVQPSLWVIVDDNSTDESPKILKDAARKFPYIRVVSFPERKEWDIGIHYSEVCRYGFEQAIYIAEKENIDYDYIALLDADIILDKQYFSVLMNALEEDKNLGIVSGTLYSWNGKKYVKDPTREDLPWGAARIWRRKCFEDTAGYLSTYSPDVISNIKAVIRGCKTQIMDETKAYQTRPTSTARGAWLGNKKAGISAYYIHYSPYVAFLRGINRCTKRGIKEGLAFMIGYFTAWVNRYPRLDDEEIEEYNKKRFRETMRYWMNR